jgi:hypothetical protein
MIEQKIATQKAFRLDTRIINKIDVLSKITGRSQNDLAEMAFKDLFIDNAIYFIESEIGEAIKESDRMDYEIAGLKFIYDENVLLIYTTNQFQELNQFCLTAIEGAFLDSPNRFATIHGINENIKAESKYYLIDCILVDKDKFQDFINEFHMILIKVDTNYLKMQEWIKSEFDFT